MDKSLILIPFREGKRLSSSFYKSNETDETGSRTSEVSRDVPQPWINLDRECGRIDFIQAMWTACSKTLADQKLSPDFHVFAKRCLCKDCESILSWVKSFTSKVAMRVETGDGGKYHRVAILKKAHSKKSTQIFRGGSPISFQATLSSKWTNAIEIKTGDILRLNGPGTRHDRSLQFLEFEFEFGKATSTCLAVPSSSSPDVDLTTPVDVTSSSSAPSRLKPNSEVETSINARVGQPMAVKTITTDCDPTTTTELPKPTRIPASSTKLCSSSCCNGDETFASSLAVPNRANEVHSSSSNVVTARKRKSTPLHVSALPSIITSAAPLESVQRSKTHRPTFVLYFVEKGPDMQGVAIHGDGKKCEGLKESVKLRGAIVLDKFDKDQEPWPTHFVLSQYAVPSTIPSELGFQNADELAEFISCHSMCAKRSWAQGGRPGYRPPLEQPTLSEKFLGLHRNKSTTNLKIGARKSVVQQVRPSPKANNNVELSKLFKELSHLYQESAFRIDDDWKSYSFNLTSGRLRHLEFNICDDPDLHVPKLKHIKGFGASTVAIIEEFVHTGSSSRLQLVKDDPERKAVREMVNIWGVGRVTANKLVKRGCKRIGDVRQCIEVGSLTVERSQYIGVLCYEDFLERMTRDEAERISKIVATAVRDRFPSAEIQTMGSYRRNKTSCGDVDVLITHPDYTTDVPSRALGVIVDELRSQGYISHHLTFISGMNHQKFESLPHTVASKLTNGLTGRTVDKKEKLSSSSWMGVFHSPIVPGRHRRVDIKWYPHNQRIFASLYFTGNGFFNRSMRLWANQKFGYRLNDHGCVDKITERAIVDNPGSEKEVFDLLELQWKAPDERDCFDSVESSVPGEVEKILSDVSKQDIGSTEEKWIS